MDLYGTAMERIWDSSVRWSCGQQDPRYFPTVSSFYFAVFVTMLLFGFSMAWLLMGGPLTAQTESFMIFFTVLAAYILVSSQEARSVPVYVLQLFISGACLGLAIAFKQIALFSCAGLL